MLKELSAGAEELLLSEDSSETEEDALSGPRPEDNGSDAEDNKCKVKSSEDGTDKDNNAQPGPEDTPDGLDANGMDP